MSGEMPKVPQGSGKHPITLVAIAANNLNASAAFYASVFGWQTMTISPEVSACVTPYGPAASLRAGNPTGFPGAVPFINVSDVKAALDRVVGAGCTVERAPWNIPNVGTMARFKDASGTVYGLTNGLARDGAPHIPWPMGDNPKPPAGTICSLEMYAADGNQAAAFFGEQFGWGTLATMPQYMGFDVGAGVGGVFQSHTPAMPAVAYIYATDVKAKLDEIDAAGGKRMGDAMAMPGMATFGYFTDPSGTTMGMIGG